MLWSCTNPGSLSCFPPLEPQWTDYKVCLAQGAVSSGIDLERSPGTGSVSSVGFHVSMPLSFSSEPVLVLLYPSETGPSVPEMWTARELRLFFLSRFPAPLR